MGSSEPNVTGTAAQAAGRVHGTVENDHAVRGGRGDGDVAALAAIGIGTIARRSGGPHTSDGNVGAREHDIAAGQAVADDDKLVIIVGVDGADGHVASCHYCHATGVVARAVRGSGHVLQVYRSSRINADVVCRGDDVSGHRDRAGAHPSRAPERSDEKVSETRPAASGGQSYGRDLPREARG